MVNLDLYRVFYTVAKCGSLTGAARELYISQPAVSLAIKQLEAQLGATLFNRTRRGVELTETGGKLIFGRVEEALSLLDGAGGAIAELASTPTGLVRIGATDSIFSYVLADRIVEFNAAYPAVKLELLSATSPETVVQLKEGRCDIAFVNLPADDAETELLGTVAHISDIFVVGERYAYLADKTMRLAELGSLPLMMIEENTVARREMRAFLSKMGAKLEPDVEVANWDFMKKLVCGGMGAGCIPREYCREELASGKLYELKFDVPLPVRGVGLAVRKGTAPSFAARKFIELFGL